MPAAAVAAEAPQLAWEDTSAGLSVVLRPGVEAAGDVRWQDALTAHVGRCDQLDAPAIIATVRAEEEGVRLTPRLQLNPSLDYCARFDGSRVGDEVALLAHYDLESEWRALAPEAPPQAIRMVPEAAVVPANALRLYIEFSGPVFAKSVNNWVRLQDATLQELVAEPFVEIPEGLWDPSGKRLTLLFHPGRLKRGVGPNQAMGPPLTAGHSYRLTVQIPDGPPAEFAFAVTSADRAPIDPTAWVVAAPTNANSPIEVEFGESIDSFLAARWIWIETVTGEVVDTTVKVAPNAASAWLFPVEEWPLESLELVVDARLEDLAGNRVGRVFDRETGPTLPASPDATGEPLGLRIPIVVD